MAAAPTISANISARNANTSNISNTTDTLLSNSRRLLLKNQLHLNLNVLEGNDESVKSIAAAAAEKDGNNVETVTTVPQKQQQQQQFRKHCKVDEITVGKSKISKATTRAAVGKASIASDKTTTTTAAAAAAAATTVETSLSSSTSLLNSSSTALAKFNRIIDSTVPATNFYEHRYKSSNIQHTESQQQEGVSAPLMLSDTLTQRLALVYPDIVSTDSHIKKINFTTTKPKGKVKEKSATLDRLASAETATEAEAALYDDNQMKRNDVHYLLKQLNSFSDIEEIEIVDMEQRQQQQQQQQQELLLQLQHQKQQQTTQQHTTGIDKPHSPTATSLVIISPSALSHKGIRRYASLHQQESTQYPHASDETVDSVEQQQYLLQQFDDYLFQSCHYLETNYFAANYRTAMVESSSHEFRPSTSTTTGTCPSVTSGESLELHETEPPSVICKAGPTAVMLAMSPKPGTVLTEPMRFETQARLTSSGVQTELTASSLTDASLAKSSSSSGCSEEQRRRPPFFKCCYTPIDRWREKRSAAHTAAAAQKRSGSKRAGGGNESASGGTGPGSGFVLNQSDTVAQQHARKNGHAV